MSKNVSFWFFLLVTLSAAPQADEIRSREVINGDLIYSASASGMTEEEAIFKAESQAVRMITIECSVPHRETKIFQFSVNPVSQANANLPFKFVAQVSAGLPMDSCVEARNAPAAEKAGYTNSTLAASQTVYQRLLEGEKTQAQPTRSVAQNQQLSHPISIARFAWTPPGYDRYLTAQVDCREKVRALLRRNESVKASALAAQCRN